MIERSGMKLLGRRKFLIEADSIDRPAAILLRGWPYDIHALTKSFRGSRQRAFASLSPMRAVMARHGSCRRKRSGPANPPPEISLPPITLEGHANGATHPDPGVYAKEFSGKYLHRPVKGGVGHNLSQEAPEAFSQVVIDVSNL